LQWNRFCGKILFNSLFPLHKKDVIEKRRENKQLFTFPVSDTLLYQRNRNDNSKWRSEKRRRRLVSSANFGIARGRIANASISNIIMQRECCTYKKEECCACGHFFVFSIPLWMLMVIIMCVYDGQADYLFYLSLRACTFTLSSLTADDDFFTRRKETRLKNMVSRTISGFGNSTTGFAATIKDCIIKICFKICI